MPRYLVRRLLLTAATAATAATATAAATDAATDATALASFGAPLPQCSATLITFNVFIRSWKCSVLHVAAAVPHQLQLSSRSGLLSKAPSIFRSLFHGLKKPTLPERKSKIIEKACIYQERIFGPGNKRLLFSDSKPYPSYEV
jgi:hypothetical protein